MAECSVCYKPNSTLRCPTCRTVYCSVEHQKLVWYSHKHQCFSKNLRFIRQPDLTDIELAYVTIESASENGAESRFYKEPLVGRVFIESKVSSIKSISKLSEEHRDEMLYGIRIHYARHPEFFNIIKKEHRYLRVFCHQAFNNDMAGGSNSNCPADSELTDQLVPLFFNLFSATYSARNYPTDEASAKVSFALLNDIIEKIKTVHVSFKDSDPTGYLAWALAVRFEQMGTFYFQHRNRLRLGLATPEEVKAPLDFIKLTGWHKLGYR